MNKGLGSISQAMSLWLDFGNDASSRVQLIGLLKAMDEMHDALISVESQIAQFRDAVDSWPRVTLDLNRAKQSLVAALSQTISVLQSQRQTLTQTKGSITDTITIE